MRLSEIEAKLEDVLSYKDEYESAVSEWNDMEPTPSDADSCEDYEYARQLWLEDEPVAEDYYDPDELDYLENVVEEIKSYSCDDDPELIPESEFVDHVRDLCFELGYVDDSFPWWISIDWDETADNVKADYVVITYEGDDYYLRSC